MRAVKVGEDSSIQRMIRLVQSADAGKAKIVRSADRWAVWVVAAALVSAAVVWIWSGEVIRAVTILVVFCPCALVLATPAAVMAAIGNAARHGFLVREGDALERLATVKRVAFDKTGTLTYGTPEVAEAVAAEGENADEVFAAAAAAESMSEHPLGKAVVQSYRKSAGDIRGMVSDFKLVPGRGVSAVVDGCRVSAGNEAMMAAESVTVPEACMCEAAVRRDSGRTVVHVARDGRYAGFLALADTVRPGAAGMIKSLSEAGVVPSLLTGDHPAPAAAIASAVGISDVSASCLPEDKMRKITAWRDGPGHVCMIGDGINDAPSLKAATVGIAMGGIGSDIAVDSADIVIVNDDISELPHLIRLSKRMMHTIKLNVIFSMGLNFTAIILAACGILNPVLGALIHNAGSVAVVVNSALLLNWKSTQ